MIDRIDSFNVADVAGHANAMRFSTAIMEYVQNNWHSLAGKGHARVVLLEAGSPGGKTPEQTITFYLSDAALQVAKDLRLKFTYAGTVTRDELPANRSLLIGDQADY